ncbi:transporter substrate-binding domain-containing protein [Pseudomonas huanghezhanensis]|uniref:transporter substrate-binding domain-containing protein n=1 Tax=Pseudomonas huanghezhanensis TaxID=3002903 RepID=UPI0022861D49|nr:transporter substrate-binding domain-containing protein [Pseudomonas sp. BSw22131]
MSCSISQTITAAQSLPFKLVAPFLTLQPLMLDGTDRRWLAERGTLRVGIAIADYEPVDITSDRNRYQGVSADYLSLVSAKLSTPVQVVGFAKREQAVAALLEGSIDILTSANGFEKGIKKLAFTREYMPDRAVVVGRGDDASLLPSLKGKRIVVLDGYADAGVLKAAYPQSEVILAPNLYSALEALGQGDVDAFIGNEVIVRSYNALRPYLGLQIKFESSLPAVGFSFATRESDQRLLSLTDRALASLDESVGREVLSRWTVGLGADVVRHSIPFNKAEQRWVRRHSRVIVASGEFPPYIYKDTNGQWVGLNVDILNRITRMTGLQFVHKAMGSTQETLDILRKGEADMNTSLAENAERKLLLDFTYSYGGNSWVFVVREDHSRKISLSSLAGKVLALPARHALEDTIRNEYPDIRLSSVATYDEARALVETGQADATIQSEASAWLYPPGKLRVARSVEGRWSPDRFSVVKTQPELASILNKALEEFPVAEMRALRMKWLGATIAQPTLWQRIPPWFYWAAAVALLLIVVSLGWSSRLKAQIRQRVRAEVKLNDQLAFKRALLDGIPNPIYVRDLQGRLISCNRSYEESFGVSFEQMNGRRLIDVDLIPKSSAEQLHGDYLKLLQTQRPVFADRSMELFGKPIEAYQWTVPFYRADGQLQGLLGGWIDITERKRLEAEIKEAHQHAESANQAKTTFLSTMSHDIRTPMSAIIGLLELEREHAIRRGQAPSDGLGTALRAANELVTLIGESLDLAKIESGSLQLAPVPTPLRTFFQHTCELFEAQAVVAGSRLILDLEEQVQGHYHFDPQRLRQVLQNLIGNALKFTADGAVTVHVRLSAIETNQVRLKFCVEDTGIGMTQEQQRGLFQPFAQAHVHSAAAHSGSGLGLSICRELVTLMGGQISLDSEAGQGTKVSVEMTLVCATPPLAAEPEHSPIGMAALPLRVLVVDDVAANRLVLTQQLEFLGHEVVATHAGDLALALWREGLFDAVFTDCNMPDVTGYELARAVRDTEHQEQREPILIIGCTANAMLEEGARCERAGMDGLLVKPVSIAQLAQTLESLVAGPRNEADFDIRTLHRMTQADEVQLQRMLAALNDNLLTEQKAVSAAIVAPDWKALGASVHRLKGVACLIDAVPLAKACSQLDNSVRQQSNESLMQACSQLDDSIQSLRSSIAPHLKHPTL